MSRLIALRSLPVGAWFPTLMVIAWVGLAALVNPAQFGDNIEQFIWAHGLEWGYWKHPPLPTFLFAAMTRIIGPSIFTAYLMAALCVSITMYFMWKIAARLIGPHWGTVAVLLFGLQFGFSWRAQIYNHNTVLVMMIAVTVWTAMLAAERRHILLWAGAGIAAGAAMLAKYQALVPLLALLVALWRCGALASGRNRAGLAVALALAVIVFLPHLHWLIANDFLPFAYARLALRDAGPLERLRFIVGFLFTEVRYLMPALVCLGIFFIFLKRRGAAAAEAQPMDEMPTARAWLRALIGLPAVFVCSLALFGVHLEGHWVLQTFQFLPIWIAWRLRRSFPGLQLRPFLASVLIAHGIGLVAYVSPELHLSARPRLQTSEKYYPAAPLADRVVADWRKATHCPLKYVAGPRLAAGLISVYSRQFPAVLEDNDSWKSPWIDLADLQRRGAVFVGDTPQALPKQVLVSGSMNVPGYGPAHSADDKVYWGIVPPQHACH